VSLPALVHRFAVDEFLSLASGMERKAELIDGVIYDVGEESVDQHRIVMRLLRELVSLRPKLEVLSGGTVRLEPRGAPIPDVAVYRANADTSNGWFEAADLLLAVEVSLSATSRDQAKLADYARGGVPEVWVVDRVRRRLQVMVFTRPETAAGRFLTQRVFDADEVDRLEPELYIGTF
jgi:Uma2 family endonuclease